MTDRPNDLPRLSFSHIFNLPDGLGIDAHGYSLVDARQNDDDDDARKLTLSHDHPETNSTSLTVLQRTTRALEPEHTNEGHSQIVSQSLEHPNQLQTYMPASYPLNHPLAKFEDNEFQDTLQRFETEPTNDTPLLMPSVSAPLDLTFGQNHINQEPPSAYLHPATGYLEFPLFHAPLSKVNSYHSQRDASYHQHNVPLPNAAIAPSATYEPNYAHPLTRPHHSPGILIQSIRSTDVDQYKHEHKHELEHEHDEDSQDDTPVIFTRDGIILGSPLQSPEATPIAIPTTQPSRRRPAKARKRTAAPFGPPTAIPSARPQRTARLASAQRSPSLTELDAHEDPPPPTVPPALSSTAGRKRARTRDAEGVDQSHSRRRRTSPTQTTTNTTPPRAYSWTLSETPKQLPNGRGTLAPRNSQRNSETMYTVQLITNGTTSTDSHGSEAGEVDFSMHIQSVHVSDFDEGVSEAQGATGGREPAVHLSRGQFEAVAQLVPEIRQVLANLGSDVVDG